MNIKNIIDALRCNIEINGYISEPNSCPSEESSKFYGIVLHTDYILPFGLSGDEIKELLNEQGGRDDDKIVDALYNELLNLNPSLNNIPNENAREHYKYGIIMGAVSKYMVDDIIFYTNEVPIMVKEYDNYSLGVQQYGIYTKYQQKTLPLSTYTNNNLVSTKYYKVLISYTYDIDYNIMNNYLENSEIFKHKQQFMLSPETLKKIYNRAKEMSEEILIYK